MLSRAPRDLKQITEEARQVDLFALTHLILYRQLSLILFHYRYWRQTRALSLPYRL